MRVLVEGFAPDAISLARLLAAEGDQVRLAGPGPAPEEADILRAEGVAVEPHTHFFADSGFADVAYLDIWTPETAPRVEALRAAGTRLSCVSDLVLERTPVRTIGVTGTAGKTTTATLAVQLLRAAGTEVVASTTARAANLWATEEHLAALPWLRPPALLALELTSSHLCFMRASPDIAVVTCFWPDHLELHGTLDAYRRAKQTIVLHQSPDSWVVFNEDDGETAAFATLTPARRASFSLHGPVERGLYLEGGRVTAHWDAGETVVGTAADLPLAKAQRANVLAAATAALAAGLEPGSLSGRLSSLQPPPHRGRVVARTSSGTAIVDAGLAATPAKAAAALGGFDDGSVVLVAGGETSIDGARVHASLEERVLLERALDEAMRAVRVCILFGPAADVLDELWAERGVSTLRAPSLEDALQQAVGVAAERESVVFAPLFPVAHADRLRFPALARIAAGRVRE